LGRVYQQPAMRTITSHAPTEKPPLSPQPATPRALDAASSTAPRTTVKDVKDIAPAAKQDRSSPRSPPTVKEMRAQRDAIKTKALKKEPQQRAEASSGPQSAAAGAGATSPTDASSSLSLDPDGKKRTPPAAASLQTPARGVDPPTVSPPVDSPASPSALSDDAGAAASGAPQWVAKLSGKWRAFGWDASGPGLEELVQLKVTPDGVITGAVDDGDGVMGDDDGDCKIENGHVDATSRRVTFDQVYDDGAVTRWEATYDTETDVLKRGKWGGECVGGFEAKRDTGEQGPLNGYRAASPKVAVYAAPNASTPALGQLGLGVTAVSNLSHHDESSGTQWVQLLVKTEPQGKVQKGWAMERDSTGLEQLARAPNIDGTGIDAIMSPVGPSADELLEQLRSQREAHEAALKQLSNRNQQELDSTQQAHKAVAETYEATIQQLKTEKEEAIQQLNTQKEEELRAKHEAHEAAVQQLNTQKDEEFRAKHEAHEAVQQQLTDLTKMNDEMSWALARKNALVVSLEAQLKMAIAAPQLNIRARSVVAQEKLAQSQTHDPLLAQAAFERADTDNDGAVGAADIVAWHAVEMALPGDGDTTKSLESVQGMIKEYSWEFDDNEVKSPSGELAVGPAAFAEIRKQFIADIDLSKAASAGSLAQQQHEKHEALLAQAAFDRADADNDGAVDAADIAKWYAAELALPNDPAKPLEEFEEVIAEMGWEFDDDEVTSPRGDKAVGLQAFTEIRRQFMAELDARASSMEEKLQEQRKAHVVLAETEARITGLEKAHAVAVERLEDKNLARCAGIPRNCSSSWRL
jgi:Ca2+-binding EF-hand superfamily protein